MKLTKNIYYYLHCLCLLLLSAIFVYGAIHHAQKDAKTAMIVWSIAAGISFLAFAISVTGRICIRLCNGKNRYIQLLFMTIAAALIISPDTNIGIKLLMGNILLSGIIYCFETEFYTEKTNNKSTS